MPIVDKSTYTRRPWHLFNAHLEAAVPYLTRKIYRVKYERERLELDDGDFLDLDWIKSGKEKLMIFSHGIEGNTRDYFVEQGMMFFSQREWDVLGWNYRSCSKEMNRLPQLYHQGNIEDLHAVINHASQYSYKEIVLVGFSFGGNITINSFLG